MDPSEVPRVVEDLTAVLRDLVGPDVDLDDPVAVTDAIERAADAVGDRDPADVASLLVRLDAVLAEGTAALAELGLREVS